MYMKTDKSNFDFLLMFNGGKSSKILLNIKLSYRHVKLVEADLNKMNIRK
uniref:Uncharacterized protein n=1 Tax=Octopus bimaculoides TaxID=37653 RepID=A0A0L8IHR2_OCTBM